MPPSKYSDCALIEIIHLHDCLRGALGQLQKDVSELYRVAALKLNGIKSYSNKRENLSDLTELERKIAARFKVIWSVFKAHSSAEDEFIWPALKCKLNVSGTNVAEVISERSLHDKTKNMQSKTNLSHSAPISDSNLQDEYEKDHEKEEDMFLAMDKLLNSLRSGLIDSSKIASIADVIEAMKSHTDSLAQHLLLHLEKEESHCMPLVETHFSTDEINDLVGNIMGKRSSDIMSQILGLAVNTLPEQDRKEMIFYMKQAMIGTFFERWLSMEGWGVCDKKSPIAKPKDEEIMKSSEESDQRKISYKENSECSCKVGMKRKAIPDHTVAPSDMCKETGVCVSSSQCPQGKYITEHEMQRLIRAVATNSALNDTQKNATIQNLRKSFFRAVEEKKRNKTSDEKFCEYVRDGDSQVSDFCHPPKRSTPLHEIRNTPPAFVMKRDKVRGTTTVVWDSTIQIPDHPIPPTIPLFSPTELAPTFHDGATAAILGCPHYARSCKLVHPSSGRLHTCRLCCDQERSKIGGIQDPPLDRYSVEEVMCMNCLTLQPATDSCKNDKCLFKGKPFARYHCGICNLYDNDPQKSIYHCPFCNVCRTGKGLGIDYRHCMRCNACVAIDSNHVCIPQSLQGHCPICHESLFESIEPLRGLPCGHVMHLSCFKMFTKKSHTCPLCKKSIEDMKSHWAMIDAAIRMQPMPESYSSAKSLIYCQDCEVTTLVPYHFAGLKCGNGECGSYNTREIERKIS